MSVELDPVELGFKRPFTHEVSEVLRMKNPNSEPLAFKVKTTAPKQYCVRPNSGRIEPGQVVEISVLLQAMKEDPPIDYKCRDKFLVQTVLISAAQELPNVSAIWANIEQTAKSSIQEKKIRVNFLPLPGQAGAAHMSTPARSSAIGTSHEEEPPAYSSPFSTTATPQRQSTAAVSGPVSTLESRPEGAQNLGEIREGAFNPATLHQQIGLATPVHSQHAHSPQPIQESPAQRAETAQPATSAIAGIVDSIASVLPSAEDVQASLESAKETVGNLVGQGQDHQGMRQRKATDAVNQDANARFGSGHTSMGMQQGAPSGVPVPMVAALCLMCFLVAYLLF